MEVRTLESVQYKLNLAVSFVEELKGYIFSPLQKNLITL
jgi:hypothetical protein